MQLFTMKSKFLIGRDVIQQKKNAEKTLKKRVKNAKKTLSLFFVQKTPKKRPKNGVGKKRKKNAKKTPEKLFPYFMRFIKVFFNKIRKF